MGIKDTKELKKFTAKTDAGKKYTIIQFQEYIEAASADHPKTTIPGSKFMRTADGLHVDIIDSKTFKIVETDEIVKKI